MIVVSDTSAITALLQIHQAQILARLYQDIIIPREVEMELRRNHKILPEFIRVDIVRDLKNFHRLRTILDTGEAAAITLMLEGRGDLLLIDERRGRRVAEQEGVPIIGVLGVLLEAKLNKIIPSLTEILDQLQKVADFRISVALKNRALVLAGEK